MIKFDEINNTGIITLQRPKALNALNLEMIIDIKEKLIFWKSKDSIHKILIKSEGKSYTHGCENARRAPPAVRNTYGRSKISLKPLTR